MPIGDLLASITGEASQPTTLATKASSPAPKRKADDELRGSAAKRPAPLATSSSRSNGDSPRPSPRLPDRPTGTPNGRSSFASRPMGSSNPAEKRSTPASSRPGTNMSSINGGRPVTTKPTVARSAKSDPPKKGSFQEIMARAQAAQEARKGFGKIQHKTIERGMTMKERKEIKSQDTRGVRKAPIQTPQRQDRGTVRSGSVSATSASRNGNGTGSISKPASTAKGKKSLPPADEVKKVKKAALATTGYTGTARPRTQPTSKSGSGARSSTDSKDQSRPRYPAALTSHRRRYEDEEDDLDDFIEYDDEEDEPGYGRRGGYDSLEEDESDMEAGMSDIDDEERRADFHARREDKEQEELERRLKREKEDRKRQYVRGGR